MNVLFNQVKHIIEEAKKEYKGTNFCFNGCPFRIYCTNHEDFQKSCEKHLTNA